MDLTHFLYAILSGLLPPLLWLGFWLREDNLHPNPRRVIFGCFLMGMGAVLLSLILQLSFDPFIHSIALQFNYSDDATKYVIFAAIEEMAKFLAAYIVAFHAIEMDEPVDAMIYLITVALGFAALENTLFVMKSYYAGTVFIGDVTQAVSTGNMRFIGATLLHVVASSCVGIAIGLNFYKPKIMRFVFGIVGLTAGIALHSTFNLSIIKTMVGDTTGTLKVFAWVWCSVIILLVCFEEVKAVKPKIKQA
ncbi:MAG: hypothetical protein JWO73_585 [Candidatus Taylorbacteria bacterium]|nr:hypothetical protein [Candidatus Taylorbacteria bacterium]